MQMPENAGREDMAPEPSPYKEFRFPARPAFIRFPVMVNHLEFCRDKLYFRADEFFPYFHHRTPAVIAYLFPFIYGMEYFAVGEIFTSSSR